MYTLLGASFLENLQTSKGIITKMPVFEVIKVGEGIIRAGQDL